MSDTVPWYWAKIDPLGGSGYIRSGLDRFFGPASAKSRWGFSIAWSWFPGKATCFSSTGVVNLFDAQYHSAPQALPTWRIEEYSNTRDSLDQADKTTAEGSIIH